MPNDRPEPDAPDPAKVAVALNALLDRLATAVVAKVSTERLAERRSGDQVRQAGSDRPTHQGRALRPRFDLPPEEFLP